MHLCTSFVWQGRWLAKDRCRILKSEISDDDLLRPVSHEELWDENTDVGHGYRASNIEDEKKVKDLQKVHEILTLRVLAKKARDYDEADRLKDELYHEHNVRVWDKTREWNYVRSKSVQRGDIVAHDYIRAAGDSSDVDVQIIDNMLLERLRAKLKRDFEQADQLREELRLMGVRVDDGTKQWRAGVPLNERDPWQKPKINYQRRPSADEIDQDTAEISLLPVDEDLVQTILTDRHEARRTQFWKRADELLDQLLKMGIDVDDSTRSWSKVHSAYTPNTNKLKRRHATSHVHPPINDPRLDDVDLMQEIEQLMADRRRAKIRRQFDQADAIRNHLRDLGVAVNDRKRTWSFIPPKRESRFQNDDSVHDALSEQLSDDSILKEDSNHPSDFIDNHDENREGLA